MTDVAAGGGAIDRLRLAVGALLFVGSAVLVLDVIGLGGSARWYALAILVPLTVLLGVHVVSGMREGDVPALAEESEAGATGSSPVVLRAAGFVVLWAVFPFTWQYVGFVLPTFAAVVLSLVLLHHTRLVTAAVGGAIASVALYLALVGALDVALPVTGIEVALERLLLGG